jgi:hypothetical protein
MREKIYYSTLLASSLLIASVSVYGQSGPGGIGSSTNNMFWYAAGNISQSNGTKVLSWSDASGNGNTASAIGNTTAPTFRTNQINGLPALEFDGANDYMTSPSESGMSNNPNATYIIVMASDVVAQSSYAWENSFGTSSSSYQAHLHGSFLANGGSLRSFARNASGGLVVAAHSNSTSYSINSTTLNATTLSAYTNSILSTSISASFATPVAHRRLVLGIRSYLYDLPYDGKIAEMIVFNSTLGTAERVIIENHLSSKYAIALSANDHYAHDVTGHRYDVAGIGMESGNSVTTAKGASIVTMSNASTLGDGDYLLWGHDNGSTASTTATSPSFFTDLSGSRMTRIWRADMTGTPGTVDISFDMTGIGFGTGTANYILMIDTDADFSNGGVTYVSSGYSYNAGTNTATWTGVTMPDDAYFTIANVNGIFSIATGNWNSTSTWNCACIPATTNRVAVLSPHTVTVDASSNANTLSIESGATLNFTATNTLTLSGNLSSNGTLDGTNGILSMSGTTAQTITTTGSITMRELTINNSAGVSILDGTYSISHVLTLTAGNFNVNSADLFTLLSTASTTCRIATVSTGTVTGSFNIQRYVTARPDGFSDMSSPVTNSTFDDWDDEILVVYTYNPPGVYPSVWGYDETDWDYVPITSAATALVPGIGYEVYLDNDGSTATSFSATTITTVGTPNIGSVNISSELTATNDGWNLVGNPYASFISFASFQGASGGTIGTTWMYYDEATEDFISVTGSTIAPHQGFWIEVLSEPATATFTESMKSTSNSSTFRAAENINFRLRLSSDGLTNFTSATQFVFDENSTQAYEPGVDVTFKKVPHFLAPALYTVTAEGKNLRVNALNKTEEMVLPVHFKVGIDGYYIISSENMEIAQSEGFNCISIEDKLTGQIHDLSSGDYRFFATTSENSDRFILHMSNNDCRTAIAGNTFPDLKIEYRSEGVIITFPEDEATSLISVYNPLGQEITNIVQVVPTAGQQVKVVLPENYSGVFLVTVRSGDKLITKRYFKP